MIFRMVVDVVDRSIQVYLDSQRVDHDEVTNDFAQDTIVHFNAEPVTLVVSKPRR